MKHSLKRNGREASYDLGNIFKSTKKITKMFTLKNEASNCTLKRIDEALLTCADRFF